MAYLRNAGPYEHSPAPAFILLISTCADGRAEVLAEIKKEDGLRQYLWSSFDLYKRRRH